MPHVFGKMNDFQSQRRSSSQFGGNLQHQFLYFFEKQQEDNNLLLLEAVNRGITVLVVCVCVYVFWFFFQSSFLPHSLCWVTPLKSRRENKVSALN